MQEIFTLNPPVLNIFHPDNHRPFKLGTGSSILLISWSVFFGNSIAFTLASAVQRGASLSDFELPQLITFGVLTIAIITYGVRAIDGPLDSILERLHGSTFEFGWARVLLAIVLIVGVAAVNNSISSATRAINPTVCSDPRWRTRSTVKHCSSTASKCS